LIVFGYDPGGENKSGVALIGKGIASAATLTGVNACLEWLTRELGNRTLEAAGIDAPLTWSTNETGLRPMDQYLRARYPNAKNSILATNSIYGSAAVQGPAMAIRLCERWPGVTINETHPKVLLYALKGRAWNHDLDAWLRGEAGASVEIHNDHEADAILSAIVTRNALTGAWTCEDLAKLADGAMVQPCGEVFYYWPAKVEARG